MARVGLIVPSSNTVMEVDLYRRLPDGRRRFTPRACTWSRRRPRARRPMLDDHLPVAMRDLASARPGRGRVRLHERGRAARQRLRGRAGAPHRRRDGGRGDQRRGVRARGDTGAGARRVGRRHALRRQPQREDPREPRGRRDRGRGHPRARDRRELRDRRGRPGRDRRVRRRAASAATPRSTCCSPPARTSARSTRSRRSSARLGVPVDDQQPGRARGSAGPRSARRRPSSACTPRRSSTPARARGRRRSTAVAAGGEDARVIAGGQSLAPMMMLRMSAPVAPGRHRGAAERTIERAQRHARAVRAGAPRRPRGLARTWSAALPRAERGGRLIGNVRVRTAGRSAAASPTPTPTRSCPASRWPRARRSRALGPDGERTVAGGRAVRQPLHDRRSSRAR